jgi:sortase (surface protein transpeptidase)
MKLVLLSAVALAGLALTASAASTPSRALISIPRLGYFNRPIGNGDYMLRYGPIWEPNFKERPGQGRAMVIAGHDMTYVPGYGQHGPFYNLVNLRKNDLVMIRWNGKLYSYRIAGRPVWLAESEYAVVAKPAVETVWLYSCWPRYTHKGRLWARAVLVSSRKV